MAPRLPKPKSLEEVDQLISQLMNHKAALKEDDRKADNQRKIVLGGSVNPVSRSNPAVALLFLKEMDKVNTVARDRKVSAEYLPGGSFWEKLVSAVKAGQDGPLKTAALEGIVSGKTASDPSGKTGVQTAPIEPKTFAAPAEKTTPMTPVSERKISAQVAEKPVAQTPIAGEKSDGSAVKNRVENGAGGVGSLPFAAEEKPVGPRPLPVGTPLQSLGLFGPKTPAVGASPTAD
jgi:hypothetical protein